MINSFITRSNLGASTTGILLLLVLTSKNIIIFNEEILVLLSFVAFFFTCQINLQDSVKEAFKARRDEIKFDLDGLKRADKEATQTKLYALYRGDNTKLKQVSLRPPMHFWLRHFSFLELSSIGNTREQGLSGVCKLQIQQKLKTLSSQGLELQLGVQKSLVGGLRAIALETFKRPRESFDVKRFKAYLVSQALKTLKKGDSPALKKSKSPALKTSKKSKSSALNTLGKDKPRALKKDKSPK